MPTEQQKNISEGFDKYMWFMAGFILAGWIVFIVLIVGIIIKGI